MHRGASARAASELCDLSRATVDPRSDDEYDSDDGDDAELDRQLRKPARLPVEYSDSGSDSESDDGDDDVFDFKSALNDRTPLQLVKVEMRSKDAKNDAAITAASGGGGTEAASVDDEPEKCEDQDDGMVITLEMMLDLMEEGVVGESPDENLTLSSTARIDLVHLTTTVCKVIIFPSLVCKLIKISSMV